MTPAITADALAAAAEPTLGVTVPAESLLGETPHSLCPADVIRSHRAILKMTEEVFPGGTIEVEEAVDPEIAGDPYLVVMVATPGEIEEIVAKHSEWHRQLRKVAPQTASSYRLSLDVR